MPTADDIFDAAAKLGRIIAAKRGADRRAAKGARNARRRRRYAATKRDKPAPAPSSADLDDVREMGCRCHVAAPCNYCLSLTEEGLLEESA